MTGTAQIKNNRCVTARYLFLVVVCGALLVLPETAYANRVVASSSFKSMLGISACLPVSAAFFAFLARAFQQKPGLRTQRYIFLFFTLIPAALFYAAIILSLFKRSTQPIMTALAVAGSLSVIWFTLNYIVYGIYSHIFGMPRPFLFGWVTRQRLIFLFVTLFTLSTGYLYYPKIHFYYHLAKGHAGNAQSQLWLGHAYKAPRVTRPFGDRTLYTEYNLFKARDWYEKAAGQNHPEAFIALAELYSGLPDKFYYDEQDILWRQKVDLQTAKYWAQKAAETLKYPGRLAVVERKISEGKRYDARPSAARLLRAAPSNKTQKNVHTFFWLFGFSLLNIGLFLGMYKAYRKALPLAAHHYQRFIALAVTWPTVLIAPVACLYILFFESRFWPGASQVLILTTLATALCSLVTYIFIRQVEKKPEEKRAEYAVSLAAVYWIIGVLSISLPFAWPAIINGIAAL